MLESLIQTTLIEINFVHGKNFNQFFFVKVTGLEKEKVKKVHEINEEVKIRVSGEFFSLKKYPNVSKIVYQLSNLLMKRITIEENY